MHTIYHILSTKFSYRKQRPVAMRRSLKHHTCRLPSSEVLLSSFHSPQFGAFLPIVLMVALPKKKPHCQPSSSGIHIVSISFSSASSARQAGK